MFRAYDASRERLVAVKLFKLDLPPERGHQLVAEFERMIAAELTHPVLAAPLATGISGVSAYLAQDYVAADSLDLTIRDYGAAPPASVLRVAAQLAGALDFAAAVHITHGALHPRDVLLSSDDTRLTGIGVTAALERIGFVAPVRRPYTPPERIAGGAWDRRADVFSLAALIHELMWGRRVTGLGAQAAESLTKIPGADLDALRDVFARAMAEQPADRFETALAFAEALQAACPRVSVEPEPASPARRRAAREEEPRLPLDEAAEIDAVAEPVAASAVVADELPLSPPIPAPEITYRVPPERASFWDGAQDEPPTPAPGGLITGQDPELLSTLDRTRSAVWPLVLALGVGIAIGFAGGFFAGSREQKAPAQVASPVAAPAPPAAGRDFTEAALPAAPPAPPSAANSELRTQNSELKTPNVEPRTPNVAAPAPGGRILVRTVPAGARVAVDGKDYGRSPATVRDLAHGAHRVTITQDGYAAGERRVTTSAARPSQSLTVELAKVKAAPAPRTTPAPVASTGRFTGGLVVDSRPSGASVFLDNIPVGKTPMSLAAVSAGSHAVRLEHEGYRRWSASVRIVASEQNRVTASLER